MDKSLSDGPDREDLVERNLALVGYTVRLMHLRLPPSMTMDDVMQCGFTGLVAAAGRYDPRKGGSFSTYAVAVIRGHILDGIRLYAGRANIHEKEVPYVREDGSQALYGCLDLPSVQIEIREDKALSGKGA